MSIYLQPLHDCVLHAALSEPKPAQVAPPLDGGGLLQSLVRD